MEQKGSSPALRIEFLQVQGCVHSPIVLDSLREAIRILDLHVDLLLLDIEDLFRAGDRRSGYGSPTILVEGRDLLGVKPTELAAPACRLFPSGVPSTGIIVEKLARFVH